MLPLLRHLHSPFRRNCYVIFLCDILGQFFSITPSTTSSTILFVTATPPFWAPSHPLSLPSPLVYPQSLLATHPHHPLNHYPRTFSIIPSVPTTIKSSITPFITDVHLQSVYPMSYSMAKPTRRTIHTLHSPLVNRSIISSTIPI